MAADENKNIARRFFEEMWNKNNLDLADELLVADYVHHDPSLPPEMQKGRDNYKRLLPMFLSAFPDLRGTIEDIVSEGNKVAVRTRWQGTHRGELQGIPPTGKHVDFQLMEIMRIQDGKIAEGWVVFDSLGMLQQIGAAPQPKGAAV